MPAGLSIFDRIRFGARFVFDRLASVSVDNILTKLPFLSSVLPAPVNTQPFDEQRFDGQPARRKTPFRTFPKGRAPQANHRGPPPVLIRLSKKRRRVLERDAKHRGRPYCEIVRTRVILELAKDPSVTAAAAKFDVSRKTIREWRDRYLFFGRKGLKPLAKSGRPVRIDSVSRCQVIAMACGKPVDFGVSFRSKWTISSLHAAYLLKNPDLSPMSRGSLFLILRRANIRPHRMRYWLHSPDPKFREKATEVCELYISPPRDSVVLCIDEKPGMQALGRKHPTKPPKQDKEGRFEYEYIRYGTRTLICAFNPHTGQAWGVVGPTRTGEDLVAFMELIARQYPDKHIHVVWDNLNIHYDGAESRWTKFNERHNHRFHFHYTPLHASWVNQVEMFFGIVQRRLLRHTVYDSAEALETAVLGFIEYWNQYECHPFCWKFKGYPLQIGQAAA